MDIHTKSTPQPPSGPVKLTVSVEESCANRRQHQLSRFRDRGGIFKPSARNTLVDILLGRKDASPKKSPRRSTSSSPSKRDKTPLRSEDGPGAGKSDAVSINGRRAASPVKAPRKSRVSAASKGSSAQIEDKAMEVAAEFERRGTKQASAGCNGTMAEPKRRGRPPKRRDGVGDEQIKTPKPKAKSNVTESAPRKRQTKSEKSTTSAPKSKQSAAETSDKSASRLSTILEEAEVGEPDEEEVLNVTRKAGRKGKRKTTQAGTGKKTVVADGVSEGPEVDKGLGPQSMPRTRKGSSRKLKRTETSSIAQDNNKEDLVPEAAARPQKTTKSGDHSRAGRKGTNPAPNAAEIVLGQGKQPSKLVEYARTSVKEGGSSKPGTSSTARRKRQRPDTGSGDDAEAEDQEQVRSKRIKPLPKGMTRGKKGRPRQDEASQPTCWDVNPNRNSGSASSPEPPKEVTLDRGPKKGPLVADALAVPGPGAIVGPNTRKRSRNAQDVLSQISSPPKRAKVDDVPEQGLEGAKSLSRRRAADGEVAGDDDGMLKAKSGRKPKLKENTIGSKKTPRQPAKVSKAQAKSLKKRTRGLPERALQRLKNSVAHYVDDEPDPIDFLS